MLDLHGSPNCINSMIREIPRLRVLQFWTNYVFVNYSDSKSVLTTRSPLLWQRLNTSSLMSSSSSSSSFNLNNWPNDKITQNNKITVYVLARLIYCRSHVCLRGLYGDKMHDRCNADRSPIRINTLCRQSFGFLFSAITVLFTSNVLFRHITENTLRLKTHDNWFLVTSCC